MNARPRVENCTFETVWKWRSEYQKLNHIEFPYIHGFLCEILPSNTQTKYWFLRISKSLDLPEYTMSNTRQLYKKFNSAKRITHMMTSSNGNIFRVTGPLFEEFTGHQWIPRQRPVTRSFDVSFYLRLNKRLSKQWWGRWFETPSRSL